MTHANDPRWDGLLLGASLATLDAEDGYGEILDGALGWRDGVITYVGPSADLPGDPGALAREVTEPGIDGGWITPGLVDCHTHLVFGGTRLGVNRLAYQLQRDGVHAADRASLGHGSLLGWVWTSTPPGDCSAARR